MIIFQDSSPTIEIAVSKKYSTLLILIDIDNCFPNGLYQCIHQTLVSTFAIINLIN